METTFTTLGVETKFVEHLNSLGFYKPTPVQHQAIPILLENECDFIALAATGTGKTAAYAIPLIEKLHPKSKYPQALILCPTRELASQVAEQITNLGKIKGIGVAAVYGGASYSTQIRALRSGAQVVVATPGRLIDLVEQKLLDLKQIKNLILDEADEMLSMGFKDALDTILSAIRADEKGERRIWLFSATMNREITKISEKYLSNPISVKLSTGQQTAMNVTQSCMLVSERDKLEVLRRILILEKDFYGLIFCRRREDTQNVSDFLMKGGIPADCIHGEKTQREREKILANFKEKKLQVLVATDVAARGIDISDLTHVINFALPMEVESYIHRIGRTGRGDKSGKAISFVSNSDFNLLSKIERVTKQKIVQEPLPSIKDIRKKVLDHIWDRLKEKAMNERTLSKITEVLSDLEIPVEFEELTREQLLGLVIATYEPHVLWAKQLDLLQMPEPRSGGGGRSFRPSRSGGGRPPRRDGRSGGGSRGGSRDGGYRAERDRGPASGGARRFEGKKKH